MSLPGKSGSKKASSSAGRMLLGALLLLGASHYVNPRHPLRPGLSPRLADTAEVQSRTRAVDRDPSHLELGRLTEKSFRASGSGRRSHAQTQPKGTSRTMHHQSGLRLTIRPLAPRRGIIGRSCWGRRECRPWPPSHRLRAARARRPSRPRRLGCRSPWADHGRRSRSELGSRGAVMAAGTGGGNRTVLPSSLS